MQLRSARAFVVVSGAFACVTGCVFDDALPANAIVHCQAAADCSPSEACTFLTAGPGTCVPRGNGCIVVDSTGRGSAEPDGNACADDGICVAGVCQQPACGDGVVTAARGETCDDGDDGDGGDGGNGGNGGNGGDSGDGDDCRSDCTRCGDGVLQADDDGEECDDGAASSDSQPGACRTSCRSAACGDGVRDPGEGCDEGPANDDGAADACRTDCRPAGCGDGVVDPGEDCDDGADNSDVAQAACRTTCAAASCGDGVVDPGEQCDDGAANSDVRPSACRRDCTTARCGDGAVDVGEECDDGPLNDDDDADACRTSCARAGCGDAVIDSVEVCDGSPDCRSDCLKVMVCGDRVVDAEAGEECDDGNANPVDGCGACRRQTWTTSVVVSGHVQGGDAAGLSFNGFLDSQALDVARDRSGRLFIGDGTNFRVVRIDGDGSFVTVAGGGAASPGDGGQATAAPITPTAVAVDGTGAVFIGEFTRVRRVAPDGTLSTVAGQNTSGFGGDGGPAKNASFFGVTSIAVDRAGAVFVVDTLNNRVRRIATDGTISTFAGNGVQASTGDGGAATAASLSTPQGVAVDGFGRVFISEGQRVRVVFNAIISTFAGGGNSPAVDGAFATSIRIGAGDIAVDDAGRVYLTDVGKVLRVNLDDSITVVAGTGVAGAGGDGGLATATAINPVEIGVAGDAQELLITTADRRLRAVDSAGIITTIAGTGRAFVGDGGPATSATLDNPAQLALAADGALLIPESQRVRRVAPDGTITTIMGTGLVGFAGDGGPATDARLTSPQAVAVDGLGRVLVADTNNQRVRALLADGTIVTVAGGGAGAGFDGDDGPATDARLDTPKGVVGDGADGFFIADTGHERVRHVDGAGIITTVAGTGVAGFAGDDDDARLAQLSRPSAVLVDGAGRLLISDVLNRRVRRVDVDGTITTIAGIGVNGDGGDGGPATSATLFPVGGMALDQSGRVLLAAFNRVRRIELDDTIATVAGATGAAIAGDGGPATAARLETAIGVAVDAAGDVFIAENNNGSRVRRVDAAGRITTIVKSGGVHPSGPGAFDRAAIYATHGIVVAAGSVFSAGTFGRVVRADLTRARVDVVAGYDASSPVAQSLASFSLPLGNAAGIAFDDVVSSLVVSDTAAGALRVIALDPDGDGVIDDDAAAWTSATLPLSSIAPGAIARDIATDTFVVAEPNDHCVERLDRSGAVVEVVAGECGTRGSFAGLLDTPGGVAAAASGTLYVADTGNNRVLRIDATTLESTVILGDGSPSSAGEGAPARLFPVDAPASLATDRFGNVYVTSTTTVRLIEDVDSDDADGEDPVVTIYGGGDRAAFPENASLCIQALAIDDTGVLPTAFVADACQGFVARLTP